MDKKQDTELNKKQETDAKKEQETIVDLSEEPGCLGALLHMAFDLFEFVFLNWKKEEDQTQAQFMTNKITAVALMLICFGAAFALFIAMISSNAHSY
ncbi:hypothetical protein KAJ27_02880 [bacterium]|nr:hypothetical protein [bacterium]